MGIPGRARSTGTSYVGSALFGDAGCGVLYGRY